MSEPTVVDTYTDTREHLLDELVRVDLLLRRHLEAWWADRTGPTDEFPGLFISDEEVDRLLLTGPEAEAGVSGDDDTRDESARHQTDETVSRLEAVTETVRRRALHSIEADVDVRLVALAAEFGLSPLEIDAIMLALAPDVDSKYETVYGYLLDDITRTRPTVDLLLRILTRSDAERLSVMKLYSRRSPLVRKDLVHVEEGRTIPSRVVHVQERVVEYLLGSDAVADAIDGAATVVEPGTADSHPAIADDIQETLDEIAHRLHDPGQDRLPEWFDAKPPTDVSPHGIESHDKTLGSSESREAIPNTAERPLFAAFVGPDERTADMAVMQVCADAGVSILRVDARALPSDDLDSVLAIVRREARLQSSAIHLTSVDALEPTLSPLAESQDGSDVPQAADDRLDRLVDALDVFPGDVFLSGDVSLSAALQPRLDRHEVTYVAFHRPNYEQRKTLWESVDVLPSEADSARLASTFRLTRGGIEDAVATARSLSDGALTAAVVREACRMHSRQDLNDLATEVEPTYDWNDIVLPDDRLTHLREIAGAIRHRGTVFEEWGFADKFSLGNGINVLFTGKSGTGKTMAAEIIAADIGLPLYKLELSSVLSKYIGETEKNLGRVFDAAEDSNAILFFDEADALFGKRTEISDSRDRYANVEVDYLLQRMEEHDGCVILASNLKENIDDAFRRRINATVDFPIPDEAARREIWELIFPEKTPTGEIDVEFLAGFELAGGYIKNVALTAAFMAAQEGEEVRMAHVVQALRREFQKMGKLYDLELFGAYGDALE